ncbi:MAG: allantoate amidohydrolase [Planctomycetota bacterium]
MGFVQFAGNHFFEIAATMPGITSIDVKTLKLARKLVLQRCDELGLVSDAPDQLTRLFCSPAMANAHQLLSHWMQQAGLQTHLDAVGNLIGCSSRDESKPVLIIGSHLDTVINAGKFDGTLGVLLGLAVAEVIQQNEIELPFALHVVAFSEEEGVRFGYPFIGSRGMAGSFDIDSFDRQDREGTSMYQALKSFGCMPEDFRSASYAASPERPGSNVVGFIEAHIEQCDRLQDSDIPCGVVSSIAGQTRATFEFRGKAGHAGTVPHEKRKDAVAAAAELILEIETLGRKTEGLFATVGNIYSSPGLSNVISGRAVVQLDLRHEDDSIRIDCFNKILSSLNRIADQRNITAEVVDRQDDAAVPMDARLKQCFLQAIEEEGLETKTMVSGAGHDAMIMSNVAPPCMLFIRCNNGISHHPDESVMPQDVQVSIKVMIGAILKLAENF